MFGVGSIVILPRDVQLRCLSLQSRSFLSVSLLMLARCADDLIQQGRIAAGTRAVIGRSGIGVAVRALVRFLTSPAAAPVLGATGIEPFVE